MVALAVSGVEGEAVSRACREAGPAPSVSAVHALLSKRAGSPAESAVSAAQHRLAALDARVIVAGSGAYPRRLARAWPDLGAPLWLFVRAPAGALPDRPCVAIVGTRRATLDGLTTARDLAARAARAGAVVVSGLARGIDQQAHLGALDAGGTTVAVLGSGFGVDYPAGAGRLREQIAASGGLVTEHLPGVPPRAHRFLHRNRIIAGLADAVVVVEGGQRSGALTTARLALEQGREVLACPGSLQSPQSAAPLGLIGDGASVVTRPDDVLEALGLTARPPAVADEEAAVPGGAPAEGLDPAAGEVLSLLSSVPAAVDDLTRACGRPAGVVLAAVAHLCACGLARRGASGIVRVPAGGDSGD